MLCIQNVVVLEIDCISLVVSDVILIGLKKFFLENYD